jgi:hypothetical protein
MGYNTNDDNIYKVGAMVTAKADPDLKLIIMRYYHRTYYCVDVNDPGGIQLSYFERELSLPAGVKLAKKS